MQSKASERIHQHSAKPWRLALNLFGFCLGAVHRQYMRLIYLIRSSKWLGDETGKTLATYASDQHLARTILCMCWMLNRQLPGKGRQDMFREKKITVRNKNQKLKCLMLHPFTSAGHSCSTGAHLSSDTICL